MKRRRVIVATVIGSVSLVTVALIVGLHQNLQSSPTEIRTFADGGSYLDEHERGKYSASVRINSYEMPIVAETGDSISITVATNQGAFSWEEYGLTQLVADADQLIEFPNRKTLQLAAVAIILPNAHDSFEIYDAKSFTPLLETQLRDRMLHCRIKDSGEISFEPKSPILRLGFRGTQDHTGILLDAKAFDARTEFPVLKEAGRFFGAGTDLKIIDLEIGIWHDTSLKIALDFPYNPIRKTISAADKLRSVPLSPEASFQLYELKVGRFFNLGQSSGGQSVFHKTHEDGLTALYEIVPAGAAEQSYVRWGHLGEQGDGRDSTEGIQRLIFNPDAPPDPFAETPPAVDEEPTLEVTYYQERVRVWYYLDELPGMPNSREDTADLFDVRMTLNPRQELNVFDALSMAAAAAEIDYHYSRARTSYGIDIMPDLNTTEVTPRQLLDVYLELNPDKRIIVDPINHNLLIKNKLDWRGEIQQRWERLKEDGF